MQKKLIILFLILFLSPAIFAQIEEPIDKKEVAAAKRKQKFEDYFFEALKEKAIGNYDKAIENLEKCKIINADEFTLDFEIALNYKYLKDYEKAIIYSEKALKEAATVDFDTKKWILYQLQTLYGLQKNYQKRAEMLKQLVDAMPDLRFVYIMTLKNIRNYDEAIAQMNSIEKQGKLEPYQIGFMLGIFDRLGDNDKQEQWLKQHYKKFPNTYFYPKQLLQFYKAKGYLDKASQLEQELINKGILSPKPKTQGLQALIPALKAKYDNQKSYKVLKELVLLAADKQDWQTVLKYAADGTEVFPNQPLVYLMYGVGLNNTKAYKKSTQILESGLDFVLDNPKMEHDFIKQLIIAYNGIGNTKKANQLKKQLN